MSEAEAASPGDSTSGPSIHHKAAKYVGVALAVGFLSNLVFSAGFKGGDPTAARIAAIISGVILWSAFPAGIIALWGIRKHGRERLLISGLAGIIIPPLLLLMAMSAFAKVKESSLTMYLQTAVSEMNKTAPRMIDEVTRLDGVSLEPNNTLVIKQTMMHLAAEEVNRDLWQKNTVPTLLEAFKKGPFVKAVKNGATVIYRFHGKDGKLIDEIVYKPADFN